MMTWKEFKQRVESQDVDDDTLIRFIDCDCDLDCVCVYPVARNEEDKKAVYIVEKVVYIV